MHPEKTKFDFKKVIRIKCHCSHFLGVYKQEHFHVHCKKCKQLKNIEELKNRKIFEK